MKRVPKPAPRLGPVNIMLAIVAVVSLVGQVQSAWNADDYIRLAQLAVAVMALAGAGTVDERSDAARVGEALRVLANSATSGKEQKP